jgi:dihydroorotase
MNMQNTLTIIQPDDMHIHFRDNDVLFDVVPHTARQMGKCMVMPNLKTPVTTTNLAFEYLERIKKAIPIQYVNTFTPYMTLYLTNDTKAEEVEKALKSQIIKGFKLYPAGATTLSEYGVTDLKACYSVLEQMQKLGLVLLIHGEVTHQNVDIFDREIRFIHEVLIPLRNDFPQLKISFEHITTIDAVQYVESENSHYLGASITAHHLLFNRNHMLAGGIRPHYYCLPILKRSTHQKALIKVAISGNSRFYAGTDSAPHAKYAKENICGCAGCYTALHAIELYTTVFYKEIDLDKL